MPLVTVSERPNGEPIATTPSPTSSLLESPTVSGKSCESGAETWTTAMSLDGSEPTSVAGYVLPFQNWTEIFFAPAATWAFVTMLPSES